MAAGRNSFINDFIVHKIPPECGANNLTHFDCLTHSTPSTQDMCEIHFDIQYILISRVTCFKVTQVDCMMSIFVHVGTFRISEDRALKL